MHQDHGNDTRCACAAHKLGAGDSFTLRVASMPIEARTR